MDNDRIITFWTEGETMKTQNERDLIELTLRYYEMIDENKSNQELFDVDDGIAEAAGRVKAEREKHKTDARENLKAFERSFTTDQGIAL